MCTKNTQISSDVVVTPLKYRGRNEGTYFFLKQPQLSEKYIFFFSFMRRWVMFRHYGNFFPVKLIKTVDLDPDQTYLFGSHPHGILCYGAFASFATEFLQFEKLFAGLTPRMLTLKQNFMLPGTRELIYATGACSATKEGMEALLK